MGGLIALTGATGDIGGRLLHALEDRGARVRCLSRRPEDLATRSTIRQTTVFDPEGVAGLAYWYSAWPIHDRLFGAMLRQIAVVSAAT